MYISNAFGIGYNKTQFKKRGKNIYIYTDIMEML